MSKKVFSKRFWLVIGFGFVMMMPSTAFALGRGGSHAIPRMRHDHHARRFYRPGGFGFEIFFGMPRIGTVVRVIPARHQRIVTGGVVYYYYDNVYYQECPSGYIIVPAPAVRQSVVATIPVGQAQLSSSEAMTIHVPQLGGGYVPVTLTKYKDGYLGPQGEYYPGNPTVNQLRVLYGK